MTLFILYPFDYTRLKASNNIQGTQQTIVQCLRSTIETDGIRGVYRGLLPSFVNIGIFRGVYFGIFDTFKVKTNTKIKKWLLGYVATFMAILMVYPTDTIRRRIMMTSGQNYKYRGFFDCSIKVYKKEGISAFFKGASIMFVQSIIGATIIYEYDKMATNIKNRSNY